MDSIVIGIVVAFQFGRGFLNTNFLMRLLIISMKHSTKETTAVVY